MNSEIAETLVLSVVIPAYNEAERLPRYLREVRSYGDRELGGCYEVLVVDDGSTDALPEVLREAAVGFPELRILRHEKNRGKGAAVRTGVLAAAGRFVLFADADGATPIDQECRLRGLLQSGAEIACGSRRIADPSVARRRHPVRKWLGAAFAALARWALRISVSDPQCGFKMLRREIAQPLFAETREDGYYFDLELLILAEQAGHRVEEAPVNWTEIPGSRMDFAAALRRIFGAFWRLRRLQKPGNGKPAQK